MITILSKLFAGHYWCEDLQISETRIVLYQWSTCPWWMHYIHWGGACFSPCYPRW